MAHNNVSIRAELTESEQRERIRLFKAAIGDRPISRFAKDSGLVYTTLKRVLDGETKCSCSYDVLAAIANHAEPESGVTIEKLLEVNGYHNGRLRDADQAKGLYFIKERIEEAYKGAECKLIDDEPDPMSTFEKEINARSSDGFIFSADLYAKLGDLNWYIRFEDLVSRLLRYKGINDTDLQEREVYEKALGACILKATHGNGNSKYSFLIDNNELYNRISETITQLRLKNCISVILCTYDEKHIRVLKEACCMKLDGTMFETIFQ